MKGPTPPSCLLPSIARANFAGVTAVKNRFVGEGHAEKAISRRRISQHSVFAVFCHSCPPMQDEYCNGGSVGIVNCFVVERITSSKKSFSRPNLSLLHAVCRIP